MKCPICSKEVLMMPLVPDNVLRYFKYHNSVCWNCYEGIYEKQRGFMISTLGFENFRKETFDSKKRIINNNILNNNIYIYGGN